jgi:hypothetical protein
MKYILILIFCLGSFLAQAQKFLNTFTQRQPAKVASILNVMQSRFVYNPSCTTLEEAEKNSVSVLSIEDMLEKKTFTTLIYAIDIDGKVVSSKSKIRILEGCYMENATYQKEFVVGESFSYKPLSSGKNLCNKEYSKKIFYKLSIPDNENYSVAGYVTVHMYAEKEKEELITYKEPKYVPDTDFNGFYIHTKEGKIISPPTNKPETKRFTQLAQDIFVFRKLVVVRVPSISKITFRGFAFTDDSPRLCIADKIEEDIAGYYSYLDRKKLFFPYQGNDFFTFFTPARTPNIESYYIWGGNFSKKTISQLHIEWHPTTFNWEKGRVYLLNYGGTHYAFIVGNEELNWNWYASK